ncbi:MAG: hypothetical protein KDK91_13935, partial [Gammaproteobacteria bacterium]|nr:hypothetical protein [Gammaproteobacteria bacterium]
MSTSKATPDPTPDEDSGERVAARTSITVNNRLARHLRERHAARMLARGLRAWRSPDILPYEAWLTRSYERAAALLAASSPQAPSAPRLLVPAQALTLWEQVIRDDDRARRGQGASGLLLPGQAAIQAARAHTRLHAFGSSLEQLVAHAAGDDSADVQAFARWCQQFHARCQQHALIDIAALPAWLLERAGQGLDLAACVSATSPSGGLDWMGFEQLTPSQARLLLSLSGGGVRCTLDGACLAEPGEVAGSAGSGATATRPSGCQSHLQRAEFEDGMAELDAVAAWCRRLLEDQTGGIGGKPPGDLSIAVVVPDLNARRDLIEDRLNEHLGDPWPVAGPTMAEALPSIVRTHGDGIDAERPADEAAPVADAEPPFELSLGRPLASVNLVADALSVLSVVEGAWQEPDWSRLLHSPYLLATRHEWPGRARVESRLRATAERSLGAARLAALLAGRHAGKPGAPRLALAMRSLADELPARSERQPVSVWAGRFWRWLELLGWPGRAVAEREPSCREQGGVVPFPTEATLGSAEYQAVQAFERALVSLAALEPILAGPVSAALALSELRRMLQLQVFQPRRSRPASIQVLGVLEASGQRFDHMWIVGMDRSSWPPMHDAEPLLPLSLQRQPLSVDEPGARSRSADADPGLRRAVTDLCWRSFPGVNLEDDLAQSTRLTEALIASGSHVIVSHARSGHDQDAELDLPPSTLFAPLPCTPVEMLVGSPPLRPALQMARAAPPAETVADDRGPGLPSGQVVTGGLAVIKEQAICPFRAFALYRLRATPPEVADAALDRKCIGIAVHR